MGAWSNMVDNVRDGMRSFLQIQEPVIRSYHVYADVDWDGNAIRNRIWYRGQAVELEEFFKQLPGDANRHRFWAAAPNKGREIEKLHVGLPSLIVDMLTDIVVSDLQAVTINNGNEETIWEEIADDNDIYTLLAEAVRDALVIGDGAFRISLDTSLSAYPIIEFIPGDRCAFNYRRGRLESVEFTSAVDDVTVIETYSRGRIETKARKGNNEGKPSDFGLDLPDLIEWDADYMLAVPMMFFPSKMYEGRGGSIFDARSDNFDALDETWSQWVDALRKARTKEYIPENLIPRNRYTGELMTPSAFDNAFIQIEASLAEGANNKIEVVQPGIQHDSYLSTYTNALDLCLMGLISPSTLGIDVKKLDNAEAQREKEKATLYTRNKMVTVLQQVIPRLVEASVNAWQTANMVPVTDLDVVVAFGEYANPSFESMIETIGKAKVQGIMSIEACVEELYGDTRDSEWKAQEVERLKAAEGMDVLEAPQLGITWEDILNASASEQQSVPDGQGTGAGDNQESAGDSAEG